MEIERKLRKVGGSVMVPIPPEMLDELQLRAGQPVRLVSEGGGIRIEPAETYEIDCLIDFRHPLIGVQHCKVDLTNGTFGRVRGARRRRRRPASRRPARDPMCVLGRSSPLATTPDRASRPPPGGAGSARRRGRRRRGRRR